MVLRRSPGAFASCARRACSISRICSRTNRSLARSRRISARVFGGTGSTLGGAQGIQALGRVAQRRPEAADPEAGESRLHPVDEPGPLANQVLSLAARALGVFFVKGRDRRHGAVVRLAA